MQRSWSSSEVGRDLSAVDWAATPLGPPEGWSQSLKTAVRILLSSKFAMWMAWGPELTFFCNDSYRRDTLGKKYPWALGRPAVEVWSEIWDDIGPRIHTVMSTGEATWDESLQLLLERSGFVEESYHTFSYSPLADDDGHVEGMLCVVSEVTEQAISTRRMTTLRDLAAHTSGHLTESEAVDAAVAQISTDPLSLPFALVYLADPDLGVLRLAGAAGIREGHRLAPSRIEMGDPTSPWPVQDPLAGRTVLVDLPQDAPPGPWGKPPTQAVVVPLAGAASPESYGFLVAGLSRYRPLDEAYAGFVDLVAGQIAAALTSARTFDGEKRRAETLARLDQAKTDFFTNVSHEFRTPLTLLLGPTEDALRDPTLAADDPQRTRFEVVGRNGQRLLQLVNSLLDFSRLEAGGITSRFEPVDLKQVTEPLVAMFESAASQAGLSLVVDIEPIVGDSYVDVEHWAKIVLNLLSNAFKFTFEGGITVTLRQVDGEAVLTVADTGCGIVAEELPHLFERFHRVQGAVARTHEGSGVGLAMVAELAELHGGSASVDSTPDVGTTMTVRIPLGHTHLPSAEVTTGAAPRTEVGAAPTGIVSEVWRWVNPVVEAAAPQAVATEAGRARVLVVDDNADMRAYVVGLLADHYAVTSAADGLEALERIEQSAPDLVLTDVTMPRLDGFGLLARLQSEPRTTSIPVIMLSARAGEEGTVEGLEAGAADYLVKPFSARELLARVRVNLELDRVRRIRATLERSEALLDQAQRLAKVGSWEVDLRLDSVTGSEELLRVLGYSRHEFEELGYPGVLTGVIHPDDVERVGHQLEALEVNDVTAYDMRITRPSDGEERFVTVRAALVGDEDGNPVILQGSLQDITEQRAAEQVLAAAQAREEAALREHTIAEELQRSLLPADTYDLDHLDVATFYRAGVEGTYVGGDWYDIIELSEGRTAIVMGDVMGRGVRAASVMGQLRSAVRAYASLDLAPHEVLRHLDGLVDDLSGDQIVTCVYGVFDPAEEMLCYANAGHLPPLVVGREGVVRRLGAGGPPLGAGYADEASEPVLVDTGSLIVLYTDGLVEHRGEDLDEGIRGLERELDRRGRESLVGLPEAVVGTLLPDGPDDDVAILMARVGPADLVATLTMVQDGVSRSVADARAFVVTQLDAWEVPEDVVRDLALVSSELVTNALVHGGDHVRVRLERTGERVVVLVDDDAEDALPQSRDPADDDENGRGLHIVAALSDEWGIRPTGRGKSIWSARAWEPVEGAGS